MSDGQTKPEVIPGTMLAGKYRVDKVLGMGNMGIVVAATHVGLGQRVAMKFMLPGKQALATQLERFLREARASVRLKTQHVARVTDVGNLENGAPYMVMEYLEGKDLAAQLAAHGQLPVDEAVGYLLQACEAVAEAHGAGIVHRDLKPANLFLTKSADGSPCIKVLDFGISKFTESELKLTQESSNMLGSPLYMSYEQIKSAKNVDARSDIWSLGVILYELLAGRTPFDAETAQGLFAKIYFEEPTPISTYRSDVPAPLEAAIRQCLIRDRERRWQNVAEFAAALAPFAPAYAYPYSTRVASVLGLNVAPARLTDVLVLPPEPVAVAPVAAPVAVPAARVPSFAGTGGGVAQTADPARSPSTTRKRTVLVPAAVGVAVLALAGLGVARWKTTSSLTVTGATSATVPLAAPSVPPEAPTPSPKQTALEPTASAAPIVPPAPEPTTTATPSATVAARPPKLKGSPPPQPRNPAPATMPKPPRSGPSANEIDHR